MLICGHNMQKDTLAAQSSESHEHTVNNDTQTHAHHNYTSDTITNCCQK